MLTLEPATLAQCHALALHPVPAPAKGGKIALGGAGDGSGGRAFWDGEGGTRGGWPWEGAGLAEAAHAVL